MRLPPEVHETAAALPVTGLDPAALAAAVHAARDHDLITHLTGDDGQVIALITPAG